jgi:hypothetical protein
MIISPATDSGHKAEPLRGRLGGCVSRHSREGGNPGWEAARRSREAAPLRGKTERRSRKAESRSARDKAEPLRGMAWGAGSLGGSN